MQEFEMDREMYPVEPVDGAAHPTIEMDPVGDIEAVRNHYERVVEKLNAELAEIRDARMAEQRERDALKLQVDTVQKEKEALTKQADDDMKKADKNIYKLQRRIHELTHKPILWPLLAIVGAIILAVLIGLAVDRALVASRLGEPLSYGCICVAAFFVGIIWERLGGGRLGNRKIRHTQLDTNHVCERCGN